MANVLTNLAADIYRAADIVSREMVGLIPSVTINTAVEEVAVGGTITSHVTPAATAVDVAPSMTIPEGTDQTVATKTLTLDKQRGVQIPWTGEDVKRVSGAGYETVYGDQIAQAMRTLANEIELDLATAAYQGASRAVGTAGTTPFASSHGIINEARQILVDNGIPMDGRVSLAINSSAGVNFRNLANLYKVNEAGNDDLLRRGILTDISGVMIRESGQIVSHTKGTGTSYLLNGAGAVGATALTVDTGSGTLLAGDVITIAGTTAHKYVANSALSGGSFTIGDPGLRVLEADNDAITIGNSYAANVMLHQSALELAMRAPAVPLGGDAAVDRMLVQDPVSGLVFEISVYKGFKKAMILVGAVWGKKVWNSKAIATVMG